MRTFSWAALLVVAGAANAQQLPFPTTLNPKFLYAGSGATQLVISNQSYGPGLITRWNGSPRPAVQGAYGPSAYTITLTAADLADSQVAVITMVDSKSGAIIDTVNCPVGFHFNPTGIAVD